jgi:RNA recognition motif-containing protein
LTFFRAQNNIVFIGDLPTSQLTNNDIDTLLNSFVNQNEKKKAHAGGNETTGELLPVDKVRVFKDSIYVSFVDEKDAQDAVAFFNGFRFKGFALRSFYTDSSRLRHKTPQAETSFIPETTPTNSKIARFQFTKTECEIIVVNRCLKYVIFVFQVKTSIREVNFFLDF